MVTPIRRTGIQPNRPAESPAETRTDKPAPTADQAAPPPSGNAAQRQRDARTAQKAQERRRQPQGAATSTSSRSRTARPRKTKSQLTSDAKALFSATKAGWGIGTDEARVFRVLEGYGSSSEISALARTYRSVKGRDLRADLRSEMKSGSLPRGRLDALLAGNPARADAYTLREAMKGGGTDEKAVFDTLARAQPRMKEVARQYGQLFGKGAPTQSFSHYLHPLRKDLRGDLSGSQEKRALGLVERDIATADAAKLNYAMKGGISLATDERTVHQTLANKTPDEMTALKTAYKRDYKAELKTHLKSELSGRHLERTQRELACSMRPSMCSAPFEAALDQRTGSKACEDNDLRVLFDGKASWKERGALIDNAKDSIHLQTFIFSSDKTGWDLARQLSGKASEGVKVRVLYDAFGSNKSDDAMFDLMKKAGVEVRAYGELTKKPLDANERAHEKHLIVDGKVAVDGGMNIANEYAFGGSGKAVFGGLKKGEHAWRDVDIRVEGPAVHDIQRSFLRNWKTSGPAVAEADQKSLFPAPTRTAGGANVRVVQHRPNEDGDDHTDALYLQAIRSSTKSIHIENAYFLPNAEMRDALIGAAGRGVEVNVMTNGRATNNHGFVSDASRYFFNELIAGGVNVFEKNKGGTLHSKTATFDGQFSLVGSHNLNGRSRTWDSESIIATDDKSVARDLETRFDSGRTETHKVSLNDLEDEPFLKNSKQWGLSFMTWTF